MRRVLVIREFDRFSRILQENGFSVINCPTIQIKPVEDLRDFSAKLAGNYDGIFLTSRHAAAILRAKLGELKVNFRGKVYILGKRSFEILKEENLDLAFVESANRAEEMLAAIPLAAITGKRFLFIRGEKSLRAIPNFLAENGASVDEAVVYRNMKISLETFKIKEFADLMKTGEIAAACFFSPSAAENFLQQFAAKNLHQTKIAVIGETTADFFAQRNLKADFIASKSTAEDFAAELIEYLK